MWCRERWSAGGGGHQGQTSPSTAILVALLFRAGIISADSARGGSAGAVAGTVDLARNWPALRENAPRRRAQAAVVPRRVGYSEERLRTLRRAILCSVERFFSLRFAGLKKASGSLERRS